MAIEIPFSTGHAADASYVSCFWEYGGTPTVNLLASYPRLTPAGFTVERLGGSREDIAAVLHQSPARAASVWVLGRPFACHLRVVLPVSVGMLVSGNGMTIAHDLTFRYENSEIHHDRDRVLVELRNRCNRAGVSDGGLLR